MINRRTFIGASLGAFADANPGSQPARAADVETIYVNIGAGLFTKKI